MVIVDAIEGEGTYMQMYRFLKRTC